MKPSSPMPARVGAIIALCLAVAAMLALPVWAQRSEEASVVQGWSHQVNGMPHDWTQQHLVFSNPGTEDKALGNGAYDGWVKIVNEPRYIMQQLQRHAPVQGPAAEDVARIQAAGQLDFELRERSRILPPSTPRFGLRPALHKDWAEAMLAAAVLPSTFPAKYTFNPIGAPTCATDYVVYPTGATGSATAATVLAYNELYATTCAPATVPSVYWAYNTGAAAVTTSPVLSGDGTQVAFIQVSGGVASLVLLKWNANTTGRGVTGSLSATSPNVTLTAGTFTAADVGAQITGTGIPAGDTISAVLSGTTANLATAPAAEAAEALTIHAEAVGTPGVPPTAATAAAYRTCTAPCMFIMTLSGSPNDTYSAPFYDYGNDNLYVGDNSSKLHKFSGVFLGTPTEATPVTLNATAFDVAPPVFDPVSGCVFVGDSEGFLYSVSSGTAGNVCTGASFALFGHSENLGDGAANDGIFDAPLVDSTAEMVYAFVTDSAAIGHCAAGDNCIAQFTTSTITTGSTTAAPNNEEPVGTGAASDNLYAGTFDNVYYSSTTPASPSGNIYVVGNTGVTGGPGNLYRMPITANVLAAAATTTSLGNDHNIWASPVTEFCNNGASACTSNGTATTGGTDRIFFSAYHVAEGSCTSTRGEGCVIAWNVTTPTATALSSEVEVPFPTAATPATDLGCWGTGAFIIDNASTTTGASQVYVIGFGNPAGAAEAANSPSTTPTTCDTVTGETQYATQDSQSAL